jgi:membrane protease YdiL (CAAX protease family)
MTHNELPGAESAGEAVTYAMGTLFLVGCAVAVGLILKAVASPPPWDRRIRMLGNRPWNALDLGLVLCVVALGQVLAIALNRPDLDEHSVSYFVQFVLQTTVVFHGAAAATVWFLYTVHRMDQRQAFGVRRGHAVREAFFGVTGYLAAFPAVTLVAAVAGLLLSAMDEEQSFQQVVTMVAEPSQPVLMRVYLCVLAVVVAPVVEEVVFRGMALPVLTRYLGFPVAVAVVSAVFALMHGHVWSLAPLFAIAVAFSLAYTLTGSLRVPIVMHAIFNTVNLGNVLLFPDIVNSAGP